MIKINKDRLAIEDYENEFFFKKKNKSLNVSFNRIAFIFLHSYLFV